MWRIYNEKGGVFDEVKVDREMDDGGDAGAVLFVLDIC